MERDEARRGCGDEQAGEWVFVRVEAMLLVKLQCGFVFAVVAMSDMGGGLWQSLPRRACNKVFERVGRWVGY
jgi:succinate dehydrogenase hydrophobic anchor subunit